MGQRPETLNMEETPTPTQERLFNISERVKRVGIFASASVFVFLALHMVFRVLVDKS